jgi:hypothetical protein
MNTAHPINTPRQLCLPPPVHDIIKTPYWEVLGHGGDQTVQRFEAYIRAIDAAALYLEECQQIHRRTDTRAACSFYDHIDEIRRKRTQALQEYWEFEQGRRHDRAFKTMLRRKYGRSAA